MVVSWAGYREYVLRLGDGDAELLGTTDGEGAIINWTPADLELRNGEVWVGTGGGGISRWEDGSWKTFGRSEGLPHLYVHDIEVGPGDALWLRLGQDGDQIVVFEPPN
jgi:ligand-binding sensor domain-containing protein